MKHKTWFRLVLQAIGVLLIGLAIPTFIQHLGGYIVWRWLIPGSAGAGWGGYTTWDEVLRIILQVLPSVVQLAFGFYLLTGAPWLLNKIIPSNHPYCPECGYDLSRNIGVKCSECGTVLPEELARRQTQATTENVQ